MTSARAGAIAGFLAVLSPWAPVGAAEIQTARGLVTIEQVPTKIAVFDIAALDTLARLGVSVNGVPDRLYVPQLSALTAKSKIVGTLFEPDLEALSTLAPDLVIVGGRSSTQLDATSRVAPTIDMSIRGDDLVADAVARLEAYGTLFGKEDEARAAKAELDAALDRARAAVAGKGRALIVMTNGPKISAYGPGSRFGWVHSSLGLPPAVKDMKVATHGEAISFEFIREANPDWLIVVDRAAAIGEGSRNAEATLDNELVAATTAWKKKQVIYLPPADFYIAAGGVQAMNRILATIIAAFSAAR